MISKGMTDVYIRKVKTTHQMARLLGRTLSGASSACYTYAAISNIIKAI